MLTNNAGFNCNAARVIVTHAAWPQREEFLEAIGRRLDRTRPRGDGEQLPWALIRGLDPAAADEVCFTREAFCGVCGETALDAPDAAAFLERATVFANGTLWGTLNATILVHPATEREPAVAGALDRAIAELRYGTVAVNGWAALGFGLVVTPWGAFPGSDPADRRTGWRPGSHGSRPPAAWPRSPCCRR
jgi:hypothetical protein